MSTQEIANELWGAAIYDIHLDMLRHNITFYIKAFNKNETNFYELHARQIDSFNLNIKAGEAWDYVEVVSFSQSLMEDPSLVRALTTS